MAEVEEKEALKVVLLARQGQSSYIVYHALVQAGFKVDVVVEGRESAWKFFKRRAKRLGWLTVFGQVGYLCVAKLQRKWLKRKTQRLVADLDLCIEPFPESCVTRVPSINAAESIATLARLQPGAVLVNGTRILSGRLLAAITVPVLNTHLGITPKYRGVYGGYWALANRDDQNVGTTVHRVDTGIDTGEVLAQCRVPEARQFHSVLLPVAQLAVALPDIVKALQGAYEPRATADQESQLWYHPTLWQYLWFGCTQRLW